LNNFFFRVHKTAPLKNATSHVTLPARSMNPFFFFFFLHRSF